jgi:hypothetical protein
MGVVLRIVVRRRTVSPQMVIWRWGRIPIRWWPRRSLAFAVITARRRPVITQPRTTGRMPMGRTRIRRSPHLSFFVTTMINSMLTAQCCRDSLNQQELKNIKYDNAFDILYYGIG